MRRAIDVYRAFHWYGKTKNHLLASFERSAMVEWPMHVAMHAIQMQSMHLVLVFLVVTMASLAETESPA